MSAPSKECLLCSELFYKRQNESLKDWNIRHKFCSRSCSMKYNGPGKDTKFSKERKFVPHTAIKKGEHRSPSTQFKKGLVHSEHWKEKMLGKVPWNKGKRFTQITGEKHFAWKGGVTGIRLKIRNLPEYKDWRLRIFKRDSFTCVHCGVASIDKKPGCAQLNADHYPITFASIIDEFNISSIEEAMNCKILWDISNGRTLCYMCHLKTDTWGRRKSTKE